MIMFLFAREKCDGQHGFIGDCGWILFFLSACKRDMPSDDLTKRFKRLIDCLNSNITSSGTAFGTASEVSATTESDSRAMMSRSTGVKIIDVMHHIVCTGWKEVRAKNVISIDNNSHFAKVDDDVIGFAVEMDIAHPGDEWVDQFRNKSKKCTVCEKNNAANSIRCYSCLSKLPVEILIGPNVFTGFMYGIKYGKKNEVLTMLVRFQLDDVLVCNDLGLSLSPCHMLAVPISRYIPDWRFLLRCPSFGLRILKELEKRAWDCAETYLSGDDVEKLFQKRTAADRSDLLMGLNFPPYVAQLHVQCILAPMLPHEYSKFIRKGHFTLNRSFRWST